MYELIQTGADTWYMSAPTNMGFYRYSRSEVCALDAADKPTAEQALRHSKEQGWRRTKRWLPHAPAAPARRPLQGADP